MDKKKVSKKQKRQIRRLLEENPLSHKQLAQEIHGCEACGEVPQEKQEAVSRTVREMHRTGEVVYTVDRCVALA